MRYRIGDELEVIHCGSDVPESRKDALLDRINKTIADSWRVTRPHWSRAESPFHDHFGLVFLHLDGEVVGYSLYERMEVDGIPAVYRAGAAIMNRYQGQGAYRAMTDAILDTEWPHLGQRGRIYYAWRTRHPSVWVANARYCQAVVPSILDGREHHILQDVGLVLGAKIYPQCPMEVPSMIMRHAYDHMTYHEQPYHRSDAVVNAWFDRMIPRSEDSIFCVGLIERPAVGP